MSGVDMRVHDTDGAVVEDGFVILSEHPEDGPRVWIPIGSVAYWVEHVADFGVVVALTTGWSLHVHLPREDHGEQYQRFVEGLWQAMGGTP